ncbi:IS66 family insertion sequence element accessory protein TnpA [Lacihabitans lacunae]|uniref:IS66 family insertion sequence element accessory protein TnpB n=1 Tax=Lacihabitans lacunae TaxID=1028214 RepID=A0ABV7YQL8_9BACT
MENWKQILKDLKRSGQSIADYCREHGHRTHIILYWKQKQGQFQGKQSGFIEVKSQTDSPIEIVYPNGVRIRLGAGCKVTDIKALLDV